HWRSSAHIAHTLGRTPCSTPHVAQIQKVTNPSCLTSCGRAASGRDRHGHKGVDDGAGPLEQLATDEGLTADGCGLGTWHEGDPGRELVGASGIDALQP